MGMIAKNEKWRGRIEKCEKLLEQNNVNGMVVTYATLAGKDAPKAAGTNQASVIVRANEKRFAAVVKAKDDSAKMTSEEVKKKVIKNMSEDLIYM